MEDNDKRFLNINPDRYWFFADKWFRIIEFFILLSALNYFRVSTGSNYITILLGISYLVFLGWFLEFQEYIFAKISTLILLSKRERILIDILLFILFIVINLIIFKATSIMSINN